MLHEATALEGRRIVEDGGVGGIRRLVVVWPVWREERWLWLWGLWSSHGHGGKGHQKYSGADVRRAASTLEGQVLRQSASLGC